MQCHPWEIHIHMYIPPMKVPILPSSSSVIPKTIAIFSIFMRDQKSVNHLYLLLVFFYSIFIICLDFFIDYIISYSSINWGEGEGDLPEICIFGLLI